MEKEKEKELITFYTQKNGVIDFKVRRGYYAAASLNENDQSEIVYVPNGTLVDHVADDYMTIEPTATKSQEYTKTRVDVHRKSTVKANCPKGWSAVLVQLTWCYGDEYVSMKVKSVLFTRPFQMKEVAAFFRKEGMSAKEAKELYEKEMNVINIHPMRVFDVLEAYETVSAERAMNQYLTFEEALYVSHDHYTLVYCQQPFQFFGAEDRYPVFYRGELICTGELRQNDSFQIVLPPQEKVAFEWSSDDHRVAVLQITEEQINVTDDEAGDGDEVAYLQITQERNVANEAAQAMNEVYLQSHYFAWCAAGGLVD